jgi:hypothetical protein
MTMSGSFFSAISTACCRWTRLDDRAGRLERGLHGGENVVVVVDQQDLFAFECVLMGGSPVADSASPG